MIFLATLFTMFLAITFLFFPKSVLGYYRKQWEKRKRSGWIGKYKNWVDKSFPNRYKETAYNILNLRIVGTGNLIMSVLLIYTLIRMALIAQGK